MKLCVSLHVTVAQKSRTNKLGQDVGAATVVAVATAAFAIAAVCSSIVDLVTDYVCFFFSFDSVVNFLFWPFV